MLIIFITKLLMDWRKKASVRLDFQVWLEDILGDIMVVDRF